MCLPVPSRHVRPDVRARHARHPVLRRLPEAAQPPLPRRRRRRDRPREGRGAPGLRRRRDRHRARDRPRARAARRRRLDRAGSGASTPARRTSTASFMVIAGDRRHRRQHPHLRRRRERAMLVNVVDVPPLCNFILPAIVRTGPLAIAISTAGASPALAKRMKRQIAEQYGEPYARAGGHAQRRARLGEGDAADLPGPQGVLRGHRQRRARPDRAAARRRRAGGARPHPPRSSRRPDRAAARRGRPAHAPRRTRAGRMVDVGAKDVTSGARSPARSCA